MNLTNAEQLSYKLEVQIQQEKRHDWCSSANECKHLPTDEMQSCPYDEELFNDYTRKCVCCSCCASECLAAI